MDWSSVSCGEWTSNARASLAKSIEKPESILPAGLEFPPVLLKLCFFHVLHDSSNLARELRTGESLASSVPAPLSEPSNVVLPCGYRDRPYASRSSKTSFGRSEFRRYESKKRSRNGV